MGYNVEYGGSESGPAQQQRESQAIYTTFDLILLVCVSG